MEVDFGVEVSHAFADEARSYTRTRPPDRLRRRCTSGDPISGRRQRRHRGWCRANDRSLAGVSWEIYGDPGEDPSTLEVQVFYLLR
jgi:hypothetical protein